MNRPRPTPAESIAVLPMPARPTIVRPAAGSRDRLFAGWGPRI